MKNANGALILFIVRVHMYGPAKVSSCIDMPGASHAGSADPLRSK